MSRLFAIIAFCLALSATTAQAQNCEICETVITAMEGWVEQNSSISEIEQAIDQLCAYVPAFQAVVSS
jgi:hypothetical protein